MKRLKKVLGVSIEKGPMKLDKENIIKRPRQSPAIFQNCLLHGISLLAAGGLEKAFRQNSCRYM